MQQKESIANGAANNNMMSFAKTHAVANMGATSLFVMEGLNMSNVQIGTNPLSINLPDGAIVKSMHTCNIIIPGLLTGLTGHIILGLAMASLVGIRILFDSGCTVTFTEKYCNVMYTGKLILTGYKDPQTELWTLLITSDAIM